MSKLISILVVRPFYFGGAMQERGVVLEVSDAFGREMMAAGKASPAPVLAEVPAEPPAEAPAEPPAEAPVARKKGAA